ncbi:MAG: hypothetical protein P4M14_11495 [Gammaproteobacteria bacterium]|nr:hypothetical protein [Gammaproteobacteria bacterium]
MLSGNVCETFITEENPKTLITTKLFIDESEVHCAFNTFDELTAFTNWANQHIPGTLDKLNLAINTAIEKNQDLEAIHLSFSHEEFVKIHRIGGLSPFPKAVIELEEKAVEERKQALLIEMQSILATIDQTDASMPPAQEWKTITLSPDCELHLVITITKDGMSICIDENHLGENHSNVTILKQIFDRLSDRLKEDSHTLYTELTNEKQHGLFFKDRDFVPYMFRCQSMFPFSEGIDDILASIASEIFPNQNKPAAINTSHANSSASLSHISASASSSSSASFAPHSMDSGVHQFEFEDEIARQEKAELLQAIELSRQEADAIRISNANSSASSMSHTSASASSSSASRARSSALEDERARQEEADLLQQAIALSLSSAGLGDGESGDSLEEFKHSSSSSIPATQVHKEATLPSASALASSMSTVLGSPKPATPPPTNIAANEVKKSFSPI